MELCTKIEKSLLISFENEFKRGNTKIIKEWAIAYIELRGSSSLITTYVHLLLADTLQVPRPQVTISDCTTDLETILAQYMHVIKSHFPNISQSLPANLQMTVQVQVLDTMFHSKTMSISKLVDAILNRKDTNEYATTEFLNLMVSTYTQVSDWCLKITACEEALGPLLVKHTSFIFTIYLTSYPVWETSLVSRFCVDWLNNSLSLESLPQEDTLLTGSTDVEWSEAFTSLTSGACLYNDVTTPLLEYTAVSEERFRIYIYYIDTQPVDIIASYSKFIQTKPIGCRRGC